MYESCWTTPRFKVRAGPSGLGHAFDGRGVDDGERLVGELGQLAEVFKFRGRAHFCHFDGVHRVVVGRCIAPMQLQRLTEQVVLTYTAVLP